MNVLLCTLDGDCLAFNRLKKRIEDVTPTDSIQIRRGIREISRELRQSLGEYKIAVLMAKTSRDLEEYMAFKHYLKDFPNILVLPDFEKDTRLEGHKLHPRLLSHMESDFQELAAVLEKMLTNMHSKYCPKERKMSENMEEVNKQWLK